MYVHVVLSTPQETFQDVADRTGKFVVEYRRECLLRPVVVAVPSSLQQQQQSHGGGGEEGDVWQELRDLQLVPKTVSSDTAAAGRLPASLTTTRQARSAASRVA